MAFENIRIRKLTLDELDLKQILEIENLSFNQVDAYNLTDFKRWYGYDPQLCIVAETKENAHVVGYMISRILNNKLDVASLADLPEFRHQGIGTALLEYSLKKARKAGVKLIELEVRKTNTNALKFWEKMGFVKLGEIPNFYEDGGDAYQMQKKIK